MTAQHVLTVAIDGTGIAWALTCPHDGTGADEMPDATRPPCRGTGECAARGTSNSGPAATWAGQRTVIGAINVSLHATDDGLLLDRTPAPAGPTPEECAQLLAAAADYPRYSDTPDGWRELLHEEHLVRHASARAERAGTDKATVASWGKVLRAWHERSDRGGAATEKTLDGKLPSCQTRVLTP